MRIVFRDEEWKEVLKSENDILHISLECCSEHSLSINLYNTWWSGYKVEFQGIFVICDFCKNILIFLDEKRFWSQIEQLGGKSTLIKYVKEKYNIK